MTKEVLGKMKKFIVLAVSVISLFIFTGCGGNDAPASPPEVGDASQRTEIPPVGKPVIEVPDAVKGKWRAVVLVFEDKEKGKTEEHTVALGSRFTVPGSDVTIEVKEFFPAFVMQGSSITSTSNEPLNPAAQVSVTEGGSEIFTGWLFARYPTTHAFSHPRYAITLKDGVPN